MNICTKNRWLCWSALLLSSVFVAHCNCASPTPSLEQQSEHAGGDASINTDTTTPEPDVAISPDVGPHEHAQDSANDGHDRSDGSGGSDGRDAGVGSDAVGAESDGQPPVKGLIKGRFESGAPLRSCGEVARWSAPDGILLRAKMNLCGDDMAALADTIKKNLDALQAKGARAVVMLLQGTSLPASWLSRCKTWKLADPRFSGDICLPWDTNYQQDLKKALVDHFAPKMNGHPALAGVYFTTTTMTNGAEFHFRVERATFPYPGDATFRQSYFDIMKIHQEAFTAPVVFEAGHCLWLDHPADCETPKLLYRYSRDTFGREKTGIALWNCAERFWAGTGTGTDTFGMKELIEEASRDGVSIGCQTVGNFTEQPCRFSDTDVGHYGASQPGPGSGCLANDPDARPAQACVDTMRWFKGVQSQASPTVQVRGTWAENWDKEFSATGVYNTSEACKAAIDLFAP